MSDEAKKQLKVFLCHASGDKPPVRELYKRLVVEGVDAWLDQEKLLPGQDWRVEIPRAVREADVVVICLSNKSITKEGYVQREIQFALDIAQEKPEGTIFLIPARLEDCLVPERLGRWQWVDLYDENGFVKLLRSLKLRAGVVGAVVEPVEVADADQDLEKQLDQLYTEGLAAFWVEDWDRACQRFQEILRERPDHKNAAEKLAQAQRQRNLGKLYAQAVEAYKSENWLAAIHALEELLEKSSDYKDAAQLLREAKKRSQLNELYAEAKRLHAAQKWQAVIKVFEQIAVLEPNYPDPEDLLSSAQQEAAEAKRLVELNDLYRQAVHRMDETQWYEARDLLEQVHKAQLGFLDTERLLHKVQDEIVRLEELNKRTIHIHALYEQAQDFLHSKNWRKAVDKMDEIRSLDDRFVDPEGIAEKAKAELEREEQQAQRQRDLGTLYAEAVSLLDARKYQDALEKWNAIQAIDPKYKDSLRVKTRARRKLDELARLPSAAAGRPWRERITNWMPEANILATGENRTERLLLLSFVATLLFGAVYDSYLKVFKIGQSGALGRCLSFATYGGIFGGILAFMLYKTIPTWQRKQTLFVIGGWFFSYGLHWVLWVYFFDRTTPPLLALIAGLALATVTVVAIKWARPGLSLFRMLLIFVGWVLAWYVGNALGNHFSIFITNDTLISVFSVFGDALVFSLGVLFIFGMQAERLGAVMTTVFFGALGFAVGNYMADAIAVLKLSISEAIATPIALGVWGLIGGAILEMPSREARRILSSAGICAAGLLLGYLIGLAIVPVIVGHQMLASVSPIIREETALLRNISWGIGLGLMLGLMIRRASAMGVLAMIGAGAYIMTRALNVEVFQFSTFWENIVRGALIGLLLGYGYGYMRQAGWLPHERPVPQTESA